MTISSNPHSKTPTLLTERLCLRPFNMGDAPALAQHLDDISISEWITTMPHPYTLADAQWFIENCDAPLRFAIVLQKTGRLIGGIAIDRELGYWLAPAFWRLGLMKEATTALLSHWFEHHEADVPSAYFLGNARSASVLYHLGFVDHGQTEQHCRARDKMMPSQRLLLTKAAWRMRQSG